VLEVTSCMFVVRVFSLLKNLSKPCKFTPISPNVFVKVQVNFLIVFFSWNKFYNLNLNIAV